MERVLATISRHAMFSPGESCGIAVSGGSDSVCLLHLLHELAPHWGLRLGVVHIDHGIRGEASRADADFVRDLATAFSLPFHIRTVNVRSVEDNLEQAARRARLDFFAELRRSGTFHRIATGHTRSDQAETVLHRILRGSGIAGLSAIRPVTTAGLVRPLLYVTREEVQDWLLQRGIGWREDQTNRDLSYVRNRIRHELLPQLRSEFNPRLDAVLANMAEVAREEEAFWSSRIPAAVRRGAAVYLDVAQLSGSRAEARRLIRRAMEEVKGDLRQMDFEHVEAVLDVAHSKARRRRVQVPGLDVLRSFDQIRIALAGDSASASEFAFAVEPPTRAALPGEGTIDFQIIDLEGTSGFAFSYDNLENDLDWQRIRTALTPCGGSSALLQLRNWRPGDRYRPVGRAHENKIKSLFQEYRVPQWERRGWPVVTAGGAIVWSRRFGAAADFSRGARTRSVLRISDANRTGI